MTTLEIYVTRYLDYCKYQKQLDEKTLKAYRIDLSQFLNTFSVTAVSLISHTMLEDYIKTLHTQYKPKTVKRKIASIRALFHFLLYKELIAQNPFDKIKLSFREPRTLPKTIPLYAVEAFLSAMYSHYRSTDSKYQKKCILRDIAVIELLFATGIRISELCSLKTESIDLDDKSIFICGKGNKERQLQIGNSDVHSLLKKYKMEYQHEIKSCGYFFVTPGGTAFSDQAVRRMIKKYAALASLNLHITPHMFRHTFATGLLEADVDIRYIQKMLGHSSISVTEIYTHVSMAKQRDILNSKHPRNGFQNRCRI